MMMMMPKHPRCLNPAQACFEARCKTYMCAWFWIKKQEQVEIVCNENR